MKAVFKASNYLTAMLGIVGCIGLLSCKQMGSTATKHKVEISETMIVIHPPVKLDPQDRAKMDAILAHYPKAFYKIRTVENGKVTVKGKLSDVYISDAVKAEVKATKDDEGTGPQTTCTSTCPIPGAMAQAKKKQLVKELTPVLAKY